MEEGQKKIVKIILSEYGRQHIQYISAYFDTDELSILRRYIKSVKEAPPTPDSIFTIFEVVASLRDNKNNTKTTYQLVKDAVLKVDAVFPGAILSIHI
jgi:hypothetical protein